MLPKKLTYKQLLRKLQEYEEIVHNVSTIRETERALQESENKYRRLVESLERDYIIYSHDMDGNFNYLSPSIINVLGYSQDEFIGHYTEYITDSSINRDVEEHTKAGLRGEKQDPYEAEYRHKNGSRVNLKVTEVPIFDDNGNVLGIEGIVQDITELKRAEAERESFIKELEKALTEIKTLKGLIPICANCKKIRDDRGYWNQIEEYIQEHSEAKFSHGICQDCAKKLYPDLDIYGDDL